MGGWAVIFTRLVAEFWAAEYCTVLSCTVVYSKSQGAWLMCWVKSIQLGRWKSTFHFRVRGVLVVSEIRIQMENRLQMDVLRISRKTIFAVVISLLVGEKTQIPHVYGIKLFINNIKYSSNSKSNTLRMKSKLFVRSVPGFPYFTSDITRNHFVSISIYGAETLIKNEISSMRHRRSPEQFDAPSRQELNLIIK